MITIYCATQRGGEARYSKTFRQAKKDFDELKASGEPTRLLRLRLGDLECKALLIGLLSEAGVERMAEILLAVPEASAS